MLTASEERDIRYMHQNLDALIGNELRRADCGRFFPESLTWRVVDVYDLPGKNDATDGRIKGCLFDKSRARVDRALRVTKNGLRLWIPIGGGQWQRASAALAGQVRVFRNNYAEIKQSAGAREDRLDEVLDAHECSGLTDTDPITLAYESALEGRLAA